MNFDLHQLTDRITRQNSAYDRQMAERRSQARREAERLAREICTSLEGVREVWGFGSVFDETRPFSAASDIDLAINGGDLLKAVSLVQHSPFEVDVIDLTTQSAGLVASVRQYGCRLMP